MDAAVGEAIRLRGPLPLMRPGARDRPAGEANFGTSGHEVAEKMAGAGGKNVRNLMLLSI